MKYFGEPQAKQGSVRQYRFSRLHSDDTSTPLFEERPLTVREKKSYGLLDGMRYPSNGNCLTLGFRLDRRRRLIEHQRLVVDIVCGLALAGLVLMMLETELFINDVTDKVHAVSTIIKVLISISTVLLVLGILLYYRTSMQIAAMEAAIRDWSAVYTTRVWLCMAVEVFVCSIHPFPGNIDLIYTTPTGSNKPVSIDAVLSILMMSRLYLIARFAVVHSRLMTDTSSHSIGALSKIKINTMFVFKAAMTETPNRLLVLVMFTTFVVNSWAMRTCEAYYRDGDEIMYNYLEIMWLVATTFLTVGYGDTIPQSYCGRYISVCTGIMGVLTTALLVAVMARQLEQTRPEKYVFNMVTRIQIEKRRKTSAANVIKAVIQLRLLRKYTPDKNTEQVKQLYEDLLKTSIRKLRAAKQEMAHVGELNVGLVEISETANRICDLVEAVLERQDSGEQLSARQDTRLRGIELKLDEIQTLLSR